MESKNRKPVTPAQREARRKNIVEFNRSRKGKSALRHGCQSESVKQGKLPSGFDELQKLVDGFYEGWIADLGGEANLTSAKKALLWVSRGCLAIFALGLEEIRAHRRLVNDEGDPHGVLKVIGTYANTLRLNLEKVGLERQARKVGPSTLDEYLTVGEVSDTASGDSPVQQ